MDEHTKVGPVARHRATVLDDGGSDKPSATLPGSTRPVFSPYLYLSAVLRSKFTTLSPKLSPPDRTSKLVDSALWLATVWVLMLAMASSYSASLIGGTMSEVKGLVVYIATELIKSVVFFVLAFFLALAWPLPAWRAPMHWMPLISRATLLLLLTVRCGVMLRQDQGSTFDHHGEYNMLAFGLIAGPALLVGFIFMGTVWLMGSARLALKRLAVLSLVLSAVALVASVWAVHNWGYGLFGRGLDSDLTLASAAAGGGGAAAWGAALAGMRLAHMPPSGDAFTASSCRVQRPGSSIPWVSLLPHGTLNFLFDSPCTPQRAAVKWEEGALVMACGGAPAGTDPPAADDVAGWDAIPWYEPRVAVFSDRPGSAVPGDVAYMIPSGPPDRRVYFGPVRNLIADFVKGKCPGDARDSLAWRVLPRPDLEGGEHLPRGGLPSSGKPEQKLLHSSLPEKQHGPAYGPMNVLVLLLDAVSREQFTRRLTATRAWLEGVHGNGVSVFDYQRMHAVGFNTGPNTGALFRGERSSADAMTDFLGKSDAGPWNSSFKVTENTMAERARAGKKLIWSLAQAAGAVTSIAQGMCQSWTGTYPHAPGSGLHFDAFAPFCDRQAHPYPHPFSNLDGPFSIVQRCLRGRNAHTWLLDWLAEHRTRYASRHTWTAGLFMEGHEGTGEVIRSMDGDLAAFLQGMTGCVDNPLRADGRLRSSKSKPKLCKGGALNNTLVFLMADHGGHMGPYSVGSKAGNLENQLPLFTVLAPEAWLRMRPALAQAMAVNQFRLLSSYDVYDSWKSLLSLPEFHNTSVLEKYPAYHEVAARRATEERMRGVRGVQGGQWGDAVPGVYHTDAIVPPQDLVQATRQEDPRGIFREQSAGRSCEEVKVGETQCACDHFPEVHL